MQHNYYSVAKTKRVKRMKKIQGIDDISEEFQPLLNQTLKMMNEQPFDYYLSWKDKQFKSKWDIVEKQVFHHWCMCGNDLGVVQFYPLYLILETKDHKKLKIDIDICKKIFLNQGKKTFIQESLF